MALQTATNPDTGERVALVGGEWKPIEQSATNNEGVKAYLIGGSWVTDQAAPKAEAPKPAPKKAEPDVATTSPMGEDLGSAIMSEAGEGLGVMSGYVPPSPVKTASKAPYKPEVRRAIEAQYDAASPKERKKLEAAPGALGDVVRQRAQEYDRAKNLPEAARMFDPRVEERTSRLIGKGEKPEFAQVAAERGAELGVAPGQEVAAMQREGTLEGTDFDFEMQKQYKDANALVRGAMAGYQGYKQGALGVNQAVAELVGADEFARTQGLGAKEARVAVESMGQNPNYVGRMFEGAISSIAQQLPAMTAGAISGSQAIVLGSMIAQSFGQEYAEGRAKGLDGLEAATRAGLMASFEGLGEKFGLKFAMDNIRRAASGMKTDQLKDFLGNTLKKELPGEYLTTTGQFLTDLSSVGLNKNATFGDYLQQMADTTVQTLMQSGLMTGGTKALGKVTEALGGGKETGAEQIDRLRQELGTTGRPELTELQGARRPELEGEPLAPPLTKMEAARNEGIEVAAPPAPPTPPADPRKDALVQAYIEKGFMQDDAELMASQEIAALAPQQSYQDTTQQAVRSVLQAEAPNVPSAEPPPYVTGPDASESGIGLPSERTGGDTGAPTNAFERGLAIAQHLADSTTSGERRERAALEEQQQRAERTLSRAFNQQTYPNLAPVFGADWMRQTMASNPTPEQFQEAAYAKLEELSFDAQRVTGTIEPVAPAKTKAVSGSAEEGASVTPTEVKPEDKQRLDKAKEVLATNKEKPTALPEAKPGEEAMPIQRGSVAAIPMNLLTTPEALKRAGEVLSVAERTPERIRSELNMVARRGGIAEWEVRKIIGEETPSVTKAPETKQAKEERPKAQGAKPLAPAEFAPLELEAGRNEALEGEEVERALLNIDEHMKKVYGTTASGDLRKRAAGAGRPASETAKTEEERKQESKEANQFNRDVDTAIKIAGKYTERQELTAFKTKEEWEAAEEVRANNLDVVRGAIYGVSRQPGTSKGVIAAKDYVRSLKPVEREKAQKTYESTRKAPLKPMEAKSRTDYIAEQQLDMEPDLGFYSIETAKGALTQILDSPNDIEAALAARLLQKDNIKSLENVDFIVVDKTTKLKDKSVKRMLDKGTIGVFVPDTVGGTIYVRGDSYDEQGINNEIVLHETMHASGSKKIAFAMLAKEQGEPVSNNLAEAVDELQSLMERAKAAYDSKGDNISATLKFLHDKGDAFTDIQEFYAYGLTNADMKEFLLNDVQGSIEKTSGFDDFINLLLRLFGIDPKLKSGLKDLVLISHEVMQAKEPEGGKLAAMAAKANVDLINEAKAKETEAQALERKVASSKTPDEILDATGSLIGVAKNPKLIGKALGRIWTNITVPKKADLLAVLPTNVLIEIGTEAGIGNLKQIDRDVQQMATFRNTSMQRMEKIANEWIKLGNKESKKLSEVMHYSTLAQIDPSKNTSDSKLNALWNPLTPKAKDIYARARDFYLENYKLYLALLDQRLESSGIKGDINDVDSDRGRLAAAIRAEYEGKAKFAPYFPLMRYGNYWVSIGKGEKREFYMFENAGDRDLFLNESIAQRYKGITKERLLANKDIDFGDDVARLREAATQGSSALKKMFELVDSMTSASNEEKARLRDEIFQMHLLTLPDNSFRNMFLHRKETAGFSGDALRNFITSGTKFAGQLSRIKYGPKLKNSVSAAYDSLEGNTDKGKLETLVKEIELRIEDQVNPPFTDSAFDSFVRFANKFAFMYALTTAKSALNNTFGLATNTVWTLAKYHGLGASTMEMAKFLNPISRQVGVAKVNSKGNIEYTFPSVASSKIVRNNKELQRAMQALQDSGILQHSQTFDLWLAKKGKSGSAAGAAFEAGVRVTGALFQGSERMTREIAFLSAFQLARKKMGFNDAVNHAIDIVNESLFDYSTWNAPRIIRSPGARLITQFKKFSLFTTSYYLRNAYQMFKPLKGESRRGAMYAFFGSMMTTGLLAGATKAFGVSTMMGIWGMLQGLYNKLLDEEPEDMLKELDIVRWYNNVYLPEWCGDAEFAGMKLSDILSKGVLTSATGYDLSSGISLSNLWFKDIPSAGHWDNALMDLAEQVGPFINIASTMLSSAKDFAEGDNKKGFEKLIPAAMLRAPAVAYRYSDEGALTKNLDELKAADEFTAAQLFMQGLGFKTAGLAETTDTNYFISQAKRDIDKTRSDLIRRRLKAEERGDEAMIDKVDEQIDRFGDMYTHRDQQIRAKDLREARDARRKQARKTERGLAIEKKYDEFEVLREPGLEKLESEAAQ
jgi:hypothetical protein